MIGVHRRKANEGFKIVLTCGRAVMSDYYNFSGLGFTSAVPNNILPSLIYNRFFPLKSDREGRMLEAQLGLCKIEAALLDYGFTREEVIISDPTKLKYTVSPKTKVVGIGVLDPLGLSYGSKVVKFVLRRFGLKCKKSIMSKTFENVIFDPAIRRYRPKIIVGGQGSWQIIDSNMQEKLGIDCIVEGEGEGVAGEIFEKAVHGENLPRIIRGNFVEANKVPVIRTPSRCGVIEITRGCGRQCLFCVPGLLPFRSFSKDRILEEIRLNLKAGIDQVSLQSDDALLYGSNGREPHPKALLDLLACIRALGVDEDRLGFEFFSIRSIMLNPKLVDDVSEMIGLHGHRYSVVEVGVETGSPRLLAKYMAGKVKPFNVSDWKDIVLSAAEILHSNNWRACYSLILGLPGETRDDVLQTLEIVDQLKTYNCVIVPIIFMPAGRLRKKGDFAFELMTEDRWELFFECIEHTLIKAPSFLKNNSLTKKIRNGIIRTLFYFGAMRMRRWRKSRDIIFNSPKRTIQRTALESPCGESGV